MLALRCSSQLPMNALVGAAGALGCPCLLLSPSAFGGMSGIELEFAFYLARRAFDAKGNISQKLQNEALLFLAREMNFASALRKIGAKEARDFVLVCEKPLPLAKMKRGLRLTCAKKIAPTGMGKKKGAYSEGERAVEEMALARVRN